MRLYGSLCVFIGSCLSLWFLISFDASLWVLVCLYWFMFVFMVAYKF